MHTAAPTQSGNLLDQGCRYDFMVLASLLDLRRVLVFVSPQDDAREYGCILTAARTRQSSLVKYLRALVSSFILVYGKVLDEATQRAYDMRLGAACQSRHERKSRPPKGSAN